MSLRTAILTRLKMIKHIPSLPVVVTTLQQEMEREESDAATIARIVSEDPVITLKVLKVANSVIYNKGAEIVDVQQAVTRLGLSELTNIIYAVAVLRLMPDLPHIDYVRFWRHSISVAYTAKAMIRFCSAESGARAAPVADVAFVAGLLHDLGILVLDQYFPEQYAVALDMAGRTAGGPAAADAGPEELPLYAAEAKHLGISHGEVGGAILERWALPASLVEAVSLHHDPLAADTHRTLTAVVHIANFVCNNRGVDNGTSGAATGFSDSCWEWLGLSVDEIPAIIEMADEEAKKSPTLMLLAGT